jgi:hypothetical protein
MEKWNPLSAYQFQGSCREWLKRKQRPALPTPRDNGQQPPTDRQPYTTTTNTTSVLYCLQHVHTLNHTALDLPNNLHTHSPNMTLAEEFRSRNFSKRALRQPLGA